LPWSNRLTATAYTTAIGHEKKMAGKKTFCECGRGKRTEEKNPRRNMKKRSWSSLSVTNKKTYSYKEDSGKGSLPLKFSGKGGGTPYWIRKRRDV